VARGLQAESPRDFDPKDCLGLLSEGTRDARRWLLRKDSEEAIVRPAGHLNFNNSGVLIQAAMQGVGIVYVLDIFVADVRTG
jgi:LysR family transcriptional regulator for bpeEF and oprC